MYLLSVHTYCHSMVQILKSLSTRAPLPPRVPLFLLHLRTLPDLLILIHFLLLPSKPHLAVIPSRHGTLSLMQSSPFFIHSWSSRSDCLPLDSSSGTYTFLPRIVQHMTLQSDTTRRSLPRVSLWVLITSLGHRCSSGSYQQMSSDTRGDRLTAWLASFGFCAVVVMT